MRTEVIGDATLYLGDCLEVLPTLGRVDHVICDPPYSNVVHDTRGRRGGDLRNDGGPDLERLGFAAITGTQGQVSELVAEICEGWFLAFSDIFALPGWRDSVLSAGAKSKSVCIWIKPDCAPQFNGQKPATGFECIGVFWCGDGFSKWNAGGKRGVYTHLTNPSSRHGGHPTEKPVSLMRELLGDFTNAGQTICDPFMGSGTTGVAALQLGRKFIGIELDPGYFDIACKRIEQAWKQPRLFEEPKRKPQPAPNLFDGAQP
jgi:site-specific DNA-methyltransferase (adenine-specific)